ncbi:hypothetical protein [Paraburkholderia kururiensis]|uniref:hypothetical protein n=1 Tax=Paraburkholderia kururiensis TaxID=984307 RepID=UPI000A9BC246|nr:hypothetical protein [Paraburkholderia kururiensis]
MKTIFAILSLTACAATGVALAALAISRAEPAVALLAFVTLPGVVQSARLVVPIASA